MDLLAQLLLFFFCDPIRDPIHDLICDPDRIHPVQVLSTPLEQFGSLFFTSSIILYLTAVNL